MLPPDPVIPRSILFCDPSKFLAKISPDGEFISYLAPHQGAMNVWVAPKKDVSQAKPLTSSASVVRDHWWAANSQRILYVNDDFGDENWQLHGVHILTHQHQSYTPKGAQARIFHISAKQPDKVLLGLNLRQRQCHDVYLLNIENGELELQYQNNAYWDFWADDDYKLQMGLKVGPHGGDFISFDEGAEKAPIAQISQHDLFGLFFYPRLRLGFSQDKSALFLVQSLKSDASRLVEISLPSQNVAYLSDNEPADICDVIVCPNTKVPLAYAVNRDRKRWHGLNSQVQEDIQFLHNIDDGDIEVLSQSQDNQLWLVNFAHDNGPMTFYLYDRSAKEAIYLFASHDSWLDCLFTKMHPREISARDGLRLPCYLSLPRQSDVQEKGIPFKPVPLVLLVHGGPNYRDFWGFNPLHQWLANRGYAVMSVNYRGSTGFGKNHMLKGHGEWGRKIHEDLLDALKWAIDNHITTQEQVAIMGSSFGGYATLVGLTMTPDVFCCGIDLVGPSNLETMVKHFPPYWKIMQSVVHEMVGCDPETESGKTYLAERSPLYYVHQIKKPLLIGHGKNDVRVLQSESDHMASVMKANNIPVTYVVFPNEGHRLLYPENRMAFYAVAEAFLARNLHGAVEPFNVGLQTSMEIIEDDFGLVAY